MRAEDSLDPGATIIGKVMAERDNAITVADYQRDLYKTASADRKALRKQNQKLQQQLNRINNLMIGNQRIWELDRLAMECEVEAQLVHDEYSLDEYGTGPDRSLAIDRYTKLTNDALFLRRLEWDLGELHVAVKGDTNRRGGRYDQANWKGSRP